MAYPANICSACSFITEYNRNAHKVWTQSKPLATQKWVLRHTWETLVKNSLNLLLHFWSLLCFSALIVSSCLPQGDVSRGALSVSAERGGGVGGGTAPLRQCNISLPDGSSCSVPLRAGVSIRDLLMGLCEKLCINLAAIDLFLVGGEKVQHCHHFTQVCSYRLPSKDGLKHASHANKYLTARNSAALSKMKRCCSEWFFFPFWPSNTLGVASLGVLSLCHRWSQWSFAPSNSTRGSLSSVTLARLLYNQSFLYLFLYF